LSEQKGILPPIPVLAAANVHTGEEGRLTLVGGRLVFVTEGGIRFGVKLNNIVNLEVRGEIVELDTRVSGVTIRAVRFKALKNDALKWFRSTFFSWVLSKRRESKLALDWEPASYMTRKAPGRAKEDSTLEHDYLLSRLVGSKENRAKFSELLGAKGVARLKAETQGFSKRTTIDRVAAIEFDKMAAAVFRGGWRDSYESFDKGSPIVFQSALPSIHQRGMREEFWGWFDVNQMLFDRFQQAERLGDTVTCLVVKRVAALARERIGDYAGLADEVLQGKSKVA
jgi:hypothetical protein